MFHKKTAKIGLKYVLLFPFLHHKMNLESDKKVEVQNGRSM